MYYKSLFIMSQFINEIHYVTELLSEVISISVLNDIIIKYAVIKRESFDTCLYKEVNIHKMFVMENKLVTMTTDTCLRNMMCYTWHDNKLIDRQSQTHFHVVNIIDTTTWTCSNYWYFDYMTPIIYGYNLKHNGRLPNNTLICNNYLFLNYFNYDIRIYDIALNKEIYHTISGRIKCIYKNCLIIVQNNVKIILYSVTEGIKSQIHFTSNIISVYVYDDEIYVLVGDSQTKSTIIILDFNTHYNFGFESPIHEYKRKIIFSDNINLMCYGRYIVVTDKFIYLCANHTVIVLKREYVIHDKQTIYINVKTKTINKIKKKLNQ